MAASVWRLLNPWSNPIFQRFRRSRLRFRKSVFWLLLTLIVTTFTVAMTYIVQTNSGTPAIQAARDLWLPLLSIQGLILMLKGTGAVSAGLIQDKIDQTLDYQRLTPITPLRCLLGYLFGLPALEYAMFALTLPHLAFVIVVGRVPLADLAAIYLVFFSCVILYHVTGIAVGMVMQRWIWGYLLSLLLVAFVNVLLPLVISQFGLKFLQYLSIWPVIGQKLLPLIVPASMLSLVETQNPFFAMADAVPFYRWTLSPFLFTLALQGVLIVTFSTMAVRRWKSATRHSLSKPYALAFLCGFIIVLLGNIWPAITGQRMPFAFFGQRSLDSLREVIAIGLPLVYCLVVWGLCIVLFAIVVPSHHSYLRGLRRAIKLGRDAARPWQDDSASLAFMGLFVVAALLGYGVMLAELSGAGFYAFLDAAPFRHWYLPAAFLLVLLYTLLLLQTVELKPTVMVILLVWFLPVLVAIVFGAAMQRVATTQSVIAAISPLALLVMAGMLPTEYLLPAGQQPANFDVLATGFDAGVGFVAAQIVLLALRWRALQARYGAAVRGSPADADRKPIGPPTGSAEQLESL